MGFDPVVWFMNTVFTIPLVLGAELKCSCGSKHRYLLLETDNIEINGIPKACVDDCEAFNNIRPFGTCSDGSACKDCMELEGEWENPESQTELINGREIITTDSFLMCKAKGGTIEAVTSGQEHGFSFQRVLALFEEMEEKYPGLFDQLIDPHGSLYLEEGMYEKAIQFLEDYLGERNGEVLLAPIYDMKEPKDLFVVAVLDRLLTDCDGSRYDRIINGLENTGAQTGMDQKEGWDIHKLNQQMIEMLKIDCKATSEKINTSSFARWTEEHKKFVNILGKTMEFVSNTAVLWYCSAASAASRKVLSTGGQKLAQYGDDFGKMGIYVENPKIKVDWTQYAKHGTKRLQERGMTEEMVNRIVENGKVLSQNNGNKFVYITKEGAVVVSKGGRLVTAWSRSDFDTAMLEIIKKLFGE